jgi:hypothetical protein
MPTGTDLHIVDGYGAKDILYKAWFQKIVEIGIRFLERYKILIA